MLEDLSVGASIGGHAEQRSQCALPSNPDANRSPLACVSNPRRSHRLANLSCVRIALVIPHDPASRIGGSPHRARFWRRALAPLGELTTIVVPVTSDPPTSDESPELGELITIPTMELSTPDFPWLARVAPEYLGAKWSAELVEFDIIVCFKSYLAPFAIGLAGPHRTPILLDLDDDDIDLHISRGEHEEVQQWRNLIESVTPEVAVRVSATGFADTFPIANTFAPSAVAGDNSARANTEGLVTMVGAFGYGPNIDGAQWFLEAVWPLVQQQRPQSQVVLAGLHSEQFDHGVGFVEDLDAHYQSASVAIAPLLSGSGTRIKILEAWARCVPVVSTTIGIEGLRAVNDEHALIADDPVMFAKHVVDLLDDPDRRRRIANSARDHLIESFDPDREATLVAALVQRITEPPAGPTAAADLAIAEADDGLVVHEPVRDVAHHLNPMAAIVFMHCDGRALGEIITAVEAVMPGVDDLALAVEATVDELVDKLLLLPALTISLPES